MLVRNENALIVKKELVYDSGSSSSSLHSSPFSPHVRSTRDLNKSSERNAADIQPRWLHQSSSCGEQSSPSPQQPGTPATSDLSDSTTAARKEKSLYVHTSRIPLSPTKTMSMTTASPIKQVYRQLFLLLVSLLLTETKEVTCVLLALSSLSSNRGVRRHSCTIRLAFIRHRRAILAAKTTAAKQVAV